jgi:hypothetical protein
MCALTLDLSVSVLTGVVTSGIALFFFFKILMAEPPTGTQDSEIAEDELNQLVRNRLTLIPFPRKPKRRRRN